MQKRDMFKKLLNIKYSMTGFSALAKISKLLLIFPFVFISFCTQAQNDDFYQGYVVSLSKDTLHGYILKDTDFQNSHAIKFKYNKAQPTIVTLTPDTLLAYAIEGNKIYTSQKVIINKKERHLFLREVITGYADLYYARERGGEEMYFIRKNGGEIVYLNRKILISILGSYLSDCKEMDFTKPSAVHIFKYSLSSLSETISTYNNCVKPSIASEVKMKPEKIPFSRGIKLGGSINDLYYTIEGGNFYNEDFQHKKSMVGGIYLNFPLTKVWSFQPEFFIITKGASLYRPSATTTSYSETVSIKLNYIQLPLAFKYAFKSKNFRPFLIFGPGVSICFNQKADYKLINTTSKTEINRIAFKIDKLAYGYFAGFGISKPISNKNILSIEARYDKSYTNMHHAYNRIAFTSLQVTAGISF